MENQADMLRKVRALIAKADASEFPDEADAFRRGADALMFKYKIDLATAPAEERLAGGYSKPEWREIDICAMGNEWYNYYSGIALAIVRHVDARSVTLRDSRNSKYVLRVVGFGADLDYIEMLLTSATLAFGKKMEPTVDPKESDAANAYRLRMGGMERGRIANALWGALSAEEAVTEGWVSVGSGYQADKRWTTKPSNETKARNRKVTNLIKQGATEAGMDPATILGQGNSIKTFRESYANGFYFTLTSRLRNLGLERGETDKGLVLASLERQVEDMFYGEYPHLKPAQTGRDDYIAPNATCTKCKATKSGYCREHMYLKPSTAKRRAGAYNHEASNLGSDAARTVDLGPGGTPKAPAAPTRTELG